MLFQEVIMVTGLPGLFRVLSMAGNGMVVEDLGTRQRKRVSAAQSVGALGEMSLFTEDDDVNEPLQSLFSKMKAHEDTLRVPPSNGSDDEIRAYFEAVFPEYNRQKVYVSIMRKCLRWYHLLRDLVNFDEVGGGDSDGNAPDDGLGELPTPQGTLTGDAIQDIREQD